VVKNTWDTSNGDRNRLKDMKEKFKVLKTGLKKWNLEVFNKTKVRRQELVSETGDIDRRDDEGPLEEELRKR